MSETPITPPVPAGLLEDAAKAVETDVKAEVPALQKIVKADKSAIVAGIVHVLVLLIAAFGLHMPARDVAVMGSLVTAGLSWFLTLNLQAVSNPK